MKPSRPEAKKLSLLVTRDDLAQMFKNAQEQHKDWHETSTINISMTKGAAYNMLKKARPYDNGRLNMGVANAIREFGEYLPKEVLAKLVRKKKVKRTDIVPFHQDPIFD